MVTVEMESSLLKLKPLDRARLAETLLQSLDQSDDRVERLWVKESESRYAAYKQGRLKGVPLEDFRLR
jgi:putative addiction module component (TIGR02574 family)